MLYRNKCWSGIIVLTSMLTIARIYIWALVFQYTTCKRYVNVIDENLACGCLRCGEV